MPSTICSRFYTSVVQQHAQPARYLLLYPQAVLMATVAASDMCGIAGMNNDAPALGVILSSAVNTNGRSSALTAPHGPSQQGLLRAALQSAGMQPSHVAALQMHSNGTPLGDPIEVGAAAAVLLQVGSYATPHTSELRLSLCQALHRLYVGVLVLGKVWRLYCAAAKLAHICG